MEDARVTYERYVGVDIAAETFVAAWLAPGGQPTAPFTGEQTPAGFAALQRRLQATAVAPAATLIVLEATGCPGRLLHPRRFSSSLSARVPGSALGWSKRPGQVSTQDLVIFGVGRVIELKLVVS